MAQLLYNSAFNPEKHPTNINEFFDYFVQNEKPETAILILPTTKYVNWAKEKFIRKYFNEKKLPTPELHFYNLQDFAKLCLDIFSDCHSAQSHCHPALDAGTPEIFGMPCQARHNNTVNSNADTVFKSKYQILSDAAILAIMEEAANNADLQYFKTKNKKISLPILQKLKDIIIGLKKDGITPENMEQELIQKNIFEKQNIASAELRFADLTRIYKEYENILNEKNLLDEPAIFQTVFELLNNHEAKNQKDFLQVIDTPKCVMFSGFSEFKLPEAQFVAQFSKSKIPTVVNIDYSQIEGPNIESLPQNVRRLVVADLNQKSIGLKNLDNQNCEQKPSEHIKKWLFNETQSLYHKKILEQVKIFEMPDRMVEVKQLANLVRYLNKEKNIPFSEMCICSRQPKLYADLFREFFSESGLVINISDRFSLASASPIILIFAMLEIVANHWQRSDIERIISSQIIRKIIPDISILITVAKKYRIVGGSKNYNTEKWKNILAKHKIFLENTLKSIENTNEDDDNKNIENSINEIEKSLKIFEQLEKTLDFKNQNYTFSEFSQLIKEQIIAKLKIAENIFLQYESLYFGEENSFNEKKYSSNINPKININKKTKNISLEKFQILEEIEKNGKALSKFIDVLDELEKIEIERKGNLKYEFNELIDKLKTAISGERYNLNEKKSLGINITSIEQTRGIPYTVMILCGAVDTEFPILFQTDTFLGKELKHSEQLHNDNERILFYQFLTNNVDLLDIGKMQIFITYPAGNGNKKFVRSPFIDDLCQITSNDTVAQNILKLGEIKEKNDKKFLVENELEWLNYLTQKTDILNFLIDNSEQLTDKYKKNFERIFNYFNEKNDFQKEIKSGVKQEKLTASAKKFQAKLNSRVYSISQLENYAKCPFNFFVQNILKLRATEKYFDDELSALDFGNYLHKILEIFYAQNQTKSEISLANYKIFDLKNIDENQKNEYLKQLKNIANSLIGELDFPFFKYEKEKIIGENGILANWFFNEIEKMKEWQFSSILFEYKFGYEKNNFVILHDENGDEIKVRGKIDRIEAFENNGEIHFIISDYKSSKSSLKNEIISGKSLQIPIYLLTIKKIFEAENFIPFGGLHYVLTDGKNPKILLANWILSKKEEDYEDILEKSCNNAIAHKNNISSLIFYPDNSSKNCIYCDYSKLCRIDKKR